MGCQESRALVHTLKEPGMPGLVTLNNTLLAQLPPELVKLILVQYLARRPALKHLSQPYQFKFTFPGGVDSPHDLVIAEDGTIFVSEHSVSRISVFASDGTRLRKIGSPGEKRGMLRSPNGLALNLDGHLAVVDSGNCRIQVFDPKTGESLKRFGHHGVGEGETQLRNPYAMCVDNKGQYLVSDWGNRRICVFSPQGKWVRNFGVGLSPKGLVVDYDDSILLCEYGANEIITFNSSYEIVSRFNSHDQGTPPGFVNPNRIILDANGHIILTDQNHHRIQVFDASFNLLAQIGQQGSRPGQLHYPMAAVVHHDSTLYIADRFNGRVHVFG